MGRQFDTASRLGARIIAAAEPDYPEALTAIEDAPPVIFAGRNVALLERPSVAIVGARNASSNGKRIAARLAAELSEAGLVVVSGLARGIDTEAHKAALAGGTVAVVAGGIDITYPPENAGLQRGIFDSGCVVSEALPGTEPMARHFPRRNRIISGLTPGVIVVEAARNSGSLITARMALEQGREVFDVLRVLAAGQARRVRPLAPQTPGPAPDLQAGEAAEARRLVLEALSPAPVAVDELVRDCQVSLPVVMTILLELELAGMLERQPGHRVCLVP
jgi:DNA processing protein